MPGRQRGPRAVPVLGIWPLPASDELPASSDVPLGHIRETEGLTRLFLDAGAPAPTIVRETLDLEGVEELVADIMYARACKS